MIHLSGPIYLGIHSSNIYGNEYIRMFIRPTKLYLSLAGMDHRRIPRMLLRDKLEPEEWPPAIMSRESKSGRSTYVHQQALHTSGRPSRAISYKMANTESWGSVLICAYQKQHYIIYLFLVRLDMLRVDKGLCCILGRVGGTHFPPVSPH